MWKLINFLLQRKLIGVPNYLLYHLMALTKGKNSTQNTEFILILDDFYHETRHGLMNNKTRYLFRGSFQGFCWLTLTFCLKGPVLGTCYNCVD